MFFFWLPLVGIFAYFSEARAVYHNFFQLEGEANKEFNCLESFGVY